MPACIPPETLMVVGLRVFFFYDEPMDAFCFAYEPRSGLRAAAATCGPFSLPRFPTATQRGEVFRDPLPQRAVSPVYDPFLTILRVPFLGPKDYPVVPSCDHPF